LGYAPAWAVGDAGELGKFPVLNAIGSITLLVDNDSTGAGQRAASECSARWTAAGREIFYLVPDATGADVNDLIRSGPAGSEGSRTVGRPNPPALHVEKEPNDAVLF